MSTAQANTDGANGSSAVATAPAAAASSSAVETSTAVADAATAPAAPAPAAKAQKAKSQLEPPDYGTSNSAADIQAQQQAALEQKRLLDEMEKEVDHLDGRAASVESSLDTLEQEMHRDGLGLRGDMVAARSNMRTDIAKAKQAMDSGDTARARHYLDLAHREVEKLEAFLGHR